MQGGGIVGDDEVRALHQEPQLPDRGHPRRAVGPMAHQAEDLVNDRLLAQLTGKDHLGAEIRNEPVRHPGKPLGGPPLNVAAGAGTDDGNPAAVPARKKPDGKG